MALDTICTLSLYVYQLALALMRLSLACNIWVKVDPISVITLVTVIITGLSQIVQIYFDKLAKHQQAGYV
jgi:hypothetical protein